MVGFNNQRLHNELDNLEEREEFKLSQVQLRFKTECADGEKIEAQLSDLKQNSALATTLSEKSTPDATTILSQLARQV
jgi:hypothetical protein